MDSGNSGSMQSSSGGDDDYDSRAESISAFLNNPTFTAGSNPQAPQHSHIHMLDPLSNYFDPNPNSFQRSSSSLSNPNPLLNLDMAWTKPGRSADLGALMPSSSSSSSAQNQALLSGQLGGQIRGGAFPTAQQQQSLAQESCSRGLLSVSGTANDQAHSNTTNSNTVRNPKKRSRASRRAPTTVLTTDTTNFRAMVQEFTGIPAPPFTSSPFPRARLDLFASSALRSPHFDPPLPPYLLRPFPHKLHSPNPFLSSAPSSSAPMPSFPTTSSMVDPFPSNNPTSNSPTSINYQLSSDLGLLKQPHVNVNNMHTPILNFQSILQPPPKFPAQNSPSIIASKSQGSLEIPPSADSHLKMGVLDELGLTHAQVNANVGAGLHRNMVSPSSDGAMTRRGDNMGANNEGNDGSLVVRSLDGAGYSNTVRVTNGIVNYLEGPECIAAVPRSEGMVESWINCSSE